ncbi:MAG: peptidoglycan DD-metalloendopeptidase family protein [Fibrobacterota bacterium]
MKAKTKAKNNIISVLLIRGADNSNVGFKISQRTLHILLGLLFAFIVAVAVFIGYYTRISGKFLIVNNLVRENEELREKVKKMDALYGEIIKIRSYEKKIKILAANYRNEEQPAERKRFASDFEKNEAEFDRELDAFVQNIRTQREQSFLTIKDNLVKQKKILEFAPNLLPVDGWISRGYFDSPEKNKAEHLAVDIAAAFDSPIRAAGPGIVTFSGWKRDFGNIVEIDHGYGFISRYGHCSRTIVKKGDLVDRSQTIAFVGNSGRSSAPHLHFEVIRNGKRMDPMLFILK